MLADAHISSLGYLCRLLFFCMKAELLLLQRQRGPSSKRWLKNETIVQGIPNSDTDLLFQCRVEVKERSLGLDIVYVLVTTWQVTRCTSYDQARTKVTLRNHVHARCFMIKFAKLILVVYLFTNVSRKCGSKLGSIDSSGKFLFVRSKCSKQNFMFHFFKGIPVTRLRLSCSTPFSQLMAPQVAQVRCITEALPCVLILFSTLRRIFMNIVVKT